MKVAIYVRTSTRDQHPENQLLKLEEYAKRQGWTYEIFEEQESTRRTRPIKEQVLGLLRKREFDALLVWKLDRWGRSVSELALELEEFNQKDIDFVSMADNLDLSTPTGRLQAHIIGAFAEFERDIIRERTLLGLDRAKAEGRKLGRPRKTPEGSRVTQWRERQKKSSCSNGGL